VAASTVPHLTLTIGAAPAEAADGIYGRAYEPRFVFSWPVDRADPDLDDAARPATAFPATGGLPDDGVIDPRDTRTVLGLCLSAVHSAAVEGAPLAGVRCP
jgi:acetyl-CoA carboxylase carboxyltransferase component